MKRATPVMASFRLRFGPSEPPLRTHLGTPLLDAGVFCCLSRVSAQEAGIRGIGWHADWGAFVDAGSATAYLRPALARCAGAKDNSNPM